MGPHSLHGTVIDRTLIRDTENKQFIYDPTYFHGTGWIGGIRIDLDNDNYDEELHIKLDSDNFYAVVFDQIDGVFCESTRLPLFSNSICGNIQANDVFLKHNGERWILYCESWYQDSLCENSASWTVNAYYYESSNFCSITEIRAEGVDIYGTLDDWANDIDIAEHRPDLPLIVAALDIHDFNIQNAYWGNMICEQDPSLTMLCRAMAVQDISATEVEQFIAGNENATSGFRAALIDCSVYDYSLPEEFYLSNY